MNVFLGIFAISLITAVYLMLFLIAKADSINPNTENRIYYLSFCFFVIGIYTIIAALFYGVA